MAGLKLDGAGTAKMATLEAAMNHCQRLHSTVEQCAMAVKGKQPAAPFIPQMRRYAQPMVSILKGQFGMIAEQTTAFLLSSSRSGGNDHNRVRALREGVAQIRVQLELAVAKTIELHTASKEL
jgi:ABC-type methionine transport system ATPase subunit